LFVFPDQMRPQTLGFMGVEPVLTPNLDRFAEESFVLTEAVSNFPVCSPCRAMFMTGKYPFSNKVIHNCTSATEPNGVELQESDVCWSDILKQNDYSLGYIGKWHLDSPREPYIDCANNKGDKKWNEWCPPNRRHSFDYWYSYGTYDWHLRPMYWSTDAGRDEFHYVDQWGPEHEADKAIEYLKNESGEYRDADKPFALVVSMNPPHMAYNFVPERYREMYADLDIEETVCKKPQVPPKGSKWGDYYRKNIRDQYAMVTGVDQRIGRILKALDDNGLAEDTIVVFTSDHGDCIGMHNCISKMNPYEESFRIPFMIRWPEKVAVGSDELLFSAPDVYPTLLDLMGFADQIPDDVEGSSFAELFRGNEISGRPTSQLYLSIPGYYSAKPTFGERGVRTATHTLMIETREDGTVKEILLFDRENDPNQMWNQADEKPELVEQLTEEELKPWLEKTGDPWGENDKG